MRRLVHNALIAASRGLVELSFALGRLTGRLFPSTVDGNSMFLFLGRSGGLYCNSATGLGAALVDRAASTQDALEILAFHELLGRPAWALRLVEEGATSAEAFRSAAELEVLRNGSHGPHAGGVC